MVKGGVRFGWITWSVEELRVILHTVTTEGGENMTAVIRRMLECGV